MAVDEGPVAREIVVDDRPGAAETLEQGVDPRDLDVPWQDEIVAGVATDADALAAELDELERGAASRKARNGAAGALRREHLRELGGVEVVPREAHGRIIARPARRPDRFQPISLIPPLRST